MQTNLAYFTDVHMDVQKTRVSLQVRLAHLKKRGVVDSRLEHLLGRAGAMERAVEDYIAEDFESHPTYPWVSRIKGCGREAAAKVIGLIEGTTFSHALLADLKEKGIVQNMEQLRENWAELEQQYPDMFQRRTGIYAFDNVSKLRRFAGLAPIDGKAEKVVAGQKGIHYSPELRMMLWRLLTSLMRARGVWYEKYVENDEYYMKRCEREGIKVIPTPQGRYCLTCREEKNVPKTTKNCPDCGEKLVAKGEPAGVMFRGHVVNRAKRRTVRLWLDCLFLIWRQALGLPVRSPYIVEYGGHHLIDPWSLTDR